MDTNLPEPIEKIQTGLIQTSNVEICLSKRLGLLIERGYYEFGIWPFSLIGAFFIPAVLFTIVLTVFPLASLANNSFDRFFFLFGSTGFSSGLIAILIWNGLAKFKWPRLVRLNLAVWGSLSASPFIIYFSAMFGMSGMSWQLFIPMAVYFVLPALTGGFSALLPYLCYEHKRSMNIELLQEKKDGREQC